MKKAVVTITRVNYILSALLWILGVLVLLFNILGQWTAWHLTGFGFLFFLIHPFAASCLAIILSLISKEPKLRKKYLWHNVIVLTISVVVTIFYFSISTNWFW